MSWDGGRPVSYTHLDVYKRQEVDMKGIVAENGKVVTDEMIAGWESALERDESVSYTHLDVYKRQR